jgi:hypothetical protein
LIFAALFAACGSSPDVDTQQTVAKTGGGGSLPPCLRAKAEKIYALQ